MYHKSTSATRDALAVMCGRDDDEKTMSIWAQDNFISLESNWRFLQVIGVGCFMIIIF
jgi:hypothetical protein